MAPYSLQNSRQKDKAVFLQADSPCRVEIKYPVHRNGSRNGLCLYTLYLATTRKPSKPWVMNSIAHVLIPHRNTRGNTIILAGGEVSDILIRSKRHDAVNQMPSVVKNPLCHTDVLKEQQRFWKRILIVDNDNDITTTFKAAIEDSNNGNDANKRMEVYTSNDPVVALLEFTPILLYFYGFAQEEARLRTGLLLFPLVRPNFHETNPKWSKRTSCRIRSLYLKSTSCS